MVIDPRELTYRPPPVSPDECVKGDRPCVRCGANLRGLAVWAACPGCGLPVDERAAALGFDRPLAERPKPLTARVLVNHLDLPRGVRRRIGWALGLAAAGATVLAASMGGVFVLLMQRGQGWIDMEAGSVERVAGRVAIDLALPGAGAWFVGVLLVTPGKPPEPRTKQASDATAGRLTGLVVDKPAWWPWLVRVGAAAWIPPLLAVGACVDAGGISGGATGLARVAVLLTLLATLLSTPVFLHLKDLALVFFDDLASSRLEQSAFMLPLLMLIISALFYTPSMFAARISDLGQLIGVFQGFMLLIMFPVFAIYPVWRLMAGLWSLGSAARWSVRNDQSAEATQARFVERSLRIERAAQARRAERGGDLD